jgi:hypothetical protein
VQDALMIEMNVVNPKIEKGEGEEEGRGRYR